MGPVPAGHGTDLGTRPVERRAGTVPRAGTLVSAVVVAAVAACSIDGGQRSRTLAPGDSIPWPDLSGGRPALVWVFDAEDCLGCELTGPARSVRLLQRRLGNRMETAVVALSELGESDRAMVARFLESQRVSAAVRVLTPGEYAAEFGSGPVPAFHVVGRVGVVRALMEPDRADLWRSTEDSLTLADYLETLAEEPTISVETSRR